MFFDMSNGSGLNFRLKNFATKEELLAYTPSERTIGVVVDSYNGYVVSGRTVTPKNRSLWVQTDPASPYYFQVTNKDPIYLDPIKVWQFKNGLQNLLEAYIYDPVNGIWKTLGKLTLLNENWEGTNLGYSGEGVEVKATVDDNGAVTVDCTKEKFGTDAKKGTFFSDWKKYDLTHYKKLTFKGLFAYENADSKAIYGCLTPSDQGYASYKDIMPVKAEFTANNTSDVAIDVSSLTGMYYIGVGVQSARVRIDECYLEM